MLENIAFFQTKKEKNHRIINKLKVEGEENLLRVPTFLSGIVGALCCTEADKGQSQNIYGFAKYFSEFSDNS